MDPLTHGVLGAIGASSVAKKKEARWAVLCGFVAGLLPDLDVFIRSSEDPLLFLEYHRQFTHSIVFVPIGAGLVALVLWWVFKKPVSFSKTFLFCAVGILLHGFLDACTNYGTVLFWPFSDYRVAFNVIAIIDPLFTVPLIAALVLVLIKMRIQIARVALTFAFVYLAIGWVQKERGIALMRQVAAERGHVVERYDVKPTVFNLILWKAVYLHGNQFQSDALRLGFRTRVYEGESIRVLDLSEDFPDLEPSSRQAQDIERFRWFSDDFLAVYPSGSDMIGDIRFSLLPDEVRPIWGIILDLDRQEQHVNFQNMREVRENDLKVFRRMILGRDVQHIQRE